MYRSKFRNFICKVEGKELVEPKNTFGSVWSPLPTERWNAFEVLLEEVLDMGVVRAYTLDDAFLWDSHPESDRFSDLNDELCELDDREMDAPDWLMEMCRSWREQLDNMDEEEDVEGYDLDEDLVLTMGSTW